MPADAEPQCSNPTCRRPSGQQPGLDSDSGCRSFGKAQAGIDVRRATSRIAVQYARITPVVALKKRRVFSREDAVATSATDWRQLQTDHAERANPTCGGVRRRHVPSSGGGERSRCCWGQLQCGHSGRESRLSWHLDACRGLFGGGGATPEPWSLLQSCHVRESEICACRGLDATNGSLGNRRTAPGAWNHSPAPPRPVRQSAVRNANVPPAPSGGLVCSHPLRGMRSKRWSGAPSASLQEVRCEAPCARLPLSGGVT